MENNFQEIKRELDELKYAIKEHNHNGFNGGLVSFTDLIKTIRTITDATDLTNILATTPRNISEQILIDTTTATKKLYIYDMVGGVWRSTTLA